jgi:predicted small metal-binding protein
MWEDDTGDGMMAKYQATCPVCKAKLSTGDEQTLMQQVHDHAHDQHGLHMDERQIKELIVSERA